MPAIDRVPADPRIADSASRERKILTVLFFLIYIVFGALGHDIVFNKSDCAVCFSHDARPNISAYDPIGHFLPYARVFVCALVIAVVWLRHGARSVAVRTPLLLAPFVVLALASCAWAASPREVFRDSASLFALWLALPPVIARLGPVSTARLSLHLIAAVVIASCLFAIAFPTVGRHSGDEVVQAVHAGLWRGIFGHKNGLGAWAAYGSVFLFTHSWMAGGPRFYWWLARGCALACLAFSGSSTGLIMAAALCCAWSWFQTSRRIGFRLASLLFLLPTLVLAEGAWYFHDDVLQSIGRDATFSGRTILWGFIIDHFAQSSLFVQLFGSGYQSAGGWQFAMMLENRFGQPMTPEDSYLGLLLGLGIVGCLGFFVPYFASIRNGFRWLKHVSPERRGALELFIATLLVALVASFTEATALQPMAYDGILGFGSLFALLVTPRAPARVSGRSFRLAGDRSPPRARRRRREWADPYPRLGVGAPGPASADSDETKLRRGQTRRGEVVQREALVAAVADDGVGAHLDDMSARQRLPIRKVRGGELDLVRGRESGDDLLADGGLEDERLGSVRRHGAHAGQIDHVAISRHRRARAVEMDHGVGAAHIVGGPRGVE
jgi:O-antigen ligase